RKPKPAGDEARRRRADAPGGGRSPSTWSRRDMRPLLYSRQDSAIVHQSPSINCNSAKNYHSEYPTDALTHCCGGNKEGASLSKNLSLKSKKCPWLLGLRRVCGEKYARHASGTLAIAVAGHFCEHDAGLVAFARFALVTFGPHSSAGRRVARFR